MNRQRQRKGTAMLEALVYVSLSGVLIALTAQWFHVVFQVASQNKIRQRQHASLKRLVIDIRSDIISATKLSVPSPLQFLLTNAADEKIVYQVNEGQIERVVGDPRKPTRQETYRDLDRLRIEWVSNESTAPQRWVTMNIYRLQQLRKLSQQAEKQNAGGSSDESLGAERPLLQVRCGPRAKGLEVVQ